jgi:hypothetical protein
MIRVMPRMAKPPRGRAVSWGLVYLYFLVIQAWRSELRRRATANCEATGGRSSNSRSRRGRRMASLYLILISAGPLWVLEHRMARPAERSQAESVFPEPGLTNARLRFHTGAAEPNGPVIAETLPHISGPPSAWFVAQWHQDGPLLRPDEMTKDDPITRDSRLGRAAYAFSASDGHMHVWIYPNKVYQGFVFDLYERGGALQADGGANVFLSAEAATKDATLDAVIRYSFYAKLSKARVSFDHPAARHNGSVLAQIFSGFIFHLDNGKPDISATVFLQIQHTSSRNESIDYHSCRYDDRSVTVLFSRNLASDLQLPFVRSTGRLQRLSFILNRYVCAFLTRPLPCSGPRGNQLNLTLVPAAFDFKNWRLTSMYIGLETEDHDIRSTSASSRVQGSVEAGLQVADLRVIRYPDQRFDRTSCEAIGMVVPPEHTDAQ